MSTTKTKLPYADALALAEALKLLLIPGCERVLIAGSIRRQKREIGDLELVVQPTIEPLRDLFGETVPGLERNGLDARLALLRPTYTKNGEKYKQFQYQGASVDLFIASAETWGCVATIRTGSADFSRWLVTDRRHGGAKPSGMKFEDGRLWFNGKPVPTPEERDVFAALDLAWIEPTDRVEGRWAR